MLTSQGEPALDEATTSPVGSGDTSLWVRLYVVRPKNENCKEGEEKLMNTRRTYWLITALLLFAMALLAACGGNENATPDLGEDEGLGDLDATLPVDDTTGLDATPLAPELTVTDTVTTEVDVTEEATEEPAATATTAATATAEPTVEMTATAEVTGTADITDTADITGTETITGSFLVRASSLLNLGLNDDAGEAAGELVDILVGEDGALQFAIVDLDGVQSVVPWDDVELQPVSGMETDAEFELVWSAAVTEPMTTTLDISVLDAGSGVVDAAGLGLDASAGNLLRLTALVDEDLLDDELTDDDLDDLENAAGEEIGDIEDVLIDADAEQVVYVIVEADDDMLLADDRVVAIPWERLALNADQDGFTTDVGVTMIEGSPEINLDDAFAESEIRMDDALREELDIYWELDGGS